MYVLCDKMLKIGKSGVKSIQEFSILFLLGTFEIFLIKKTP